MREFVERAVLIALDILEITDEVALDALAAGESALDQQRNLAGIQRLGPRFRLEVAGQIALVQPETLPESDFQAIEAVVSVRVFGLPSAIPQIYLLVRVDRKEVDRIVPIAVEQRDIHVVHAGDANAHVLQQLLAYRRIFG